MRPKLTLNPPQSRVMRIIRDGLTVTLAFGRGVGKSWFVRRLAYLLISQWEYRERMTASGTITGVRVVFLLPTFKQFRDVHSRAMMRELSEEFTEEHEGYRFLGGKVDGTTFTVTFPGGSSIQVFPASEHGGQRARGIRADVVILDEADDIDASVFDEVVGPWFTEPWSLKIKIASGTPKRGRHGLLFRLHEAGRKGDRVRAGQLDGFKPEELEALRRFYTVHATYRDAPANVDRGAVELARVTMPRASFEREYECNFDSGEGLVYPFDEAFHVRQPPEIRTFGEFIVGLDHGWTDAGAMLLIGVQGHGEDATAWVLEEHYESQCPSHVWDERAVRWKQATFWADPSRPDRIDTLKSLGLNAPSLPAEVKPILAGIARVSDMMFRRKAEDGPDWARLYIAPNCKNLIRELGMYRWKKSADGTFEESPEDRHNHAADALRYALAGRFGKPPNTRHEVPGR